MTAIRLTPALDAAIAVFVGHQRVLGRRYYGEEGVLRDLRRFVVAQKTADLTAEVFDNGAAHSTGCLRIPCTRVSYSCASYVCSGAVTSLPASSPIPPASRVAGRVGERSS